MRRDRIFGQRWNRVKNEIELNLVRYDHFEKGPTCSYPLSKNSQDWKFENPKGGVHDRLAEKNKFLCETLNTYQNAI